MTGIRRPTAHWYLPRLLLAIVELCLSTTNDRVRSNLHREFVAANIVLDKIGPHFLPTVRCMAIKSLKGCVRRYLRIRNVWTIQFQSIRLCFLSGKDLPPLVTKCSRNVDQYSLCCRGSGAQFESTIWLRPQRSGGILEISSFVENPDSQGCSNSYSSSLRIGFRCSSWFRQMFGDSTSIAHPSRLKIISIGTYVKKDDSTS